MTTSVKTEVQLHLLEDLISLYTRQELTKQNINEYGDKYDKITKTWNELKRETEEQIQKEPNFPKDTQYGNVRTTDGIRSMISKVITSCTILEDAYKKSKSNFDDINRSFDLSTIGIAVQSKLQGYLRSISRDSTPRVAIFVEIDKAIEDLKPLEELAADLASEHLGQQQLQQRIQQFVADLKAILDDGKGSLALETVG